MDALLELAGSPWQRITNEAYHKSDAASRSLLWDMYATTPMHALHRRQTFAETDSMVMGTALHCAVLEPERFEIEYQPTTMSRQSKSGAAHIGAMAQQGITLIKQDLYDRVLGMRDAMTANSTMVNLLQNGCAELSIYAWHPIYGFRLKARPDYVRREGVILDIKTIDDASPESFRHHTRKFGYHMQAWMYPEVMRLNDLQIAEDNFGFLVVENTPPYATAIYVLNSREDAELLRDGRVAYENACRLYHDCITTGEWPGYPQEPLSLTDTIKARQERRRMII